MLDKLRDCSIGGSRRKKLSGEESQHCELKLGIG